MPVQHAFANLICPRWWPSIVVGVTSIGSLLVYFHGVVAMGAFAQYVLVPAIGLLALQWWICRNNHADFAHELEAVIFAGVLATFVYDFVRVPVVMSGTPVFKAISYFGMVILNRSALDPLSESVGWFYHLSNGVGFALLYKIIFGRPRWWTAILWGLSLELAMLLTPYAEVFGYKRSAKFLAITIGAHIAYGLMLWLALRWFDQAASTLAKRTMRKSGWLSVVGIAFIALGNHPLHRTSKLAPLPNELGPNLFVTWNVPEHDRILAMWLYQRRINPKARFHFVEPFTALPFGESFDVPGAVIQRVGQKATTEGLVDILQCSHEATCSTLALVAHHDEITPWRVISDPQAQTLALELGAITSTCVPDQMAACVAQSFAYLDHWHKSHSVDETSG